MDKKIERLKIDISTYNDVVSDLRDIISEFKEGYDVYQCFDDIESITDDLEVYINKSLNIVNSLKDDYKPYTNIDNIVNDMLSVGGKK